MENKTIKIADQCQFDACVLAGLIDSTSEPIRYEDNTPVFNIIEQFCYIVLDVNLEVIEDISLPCVFGNIDEAFKYALADVIKVSGTDIKIHNYTIEGYPTITTRISTQRSLGSDLGISYKSNYGSYHCTRMIVKRKIN